MINFFVPFDNDMPSAVLINGHRLLILSSELDVIEEDLPLLGANRIEIVTTEVGPEDELDAELESIARRANAGLVFAPPDLPVSEVIQNLEDELPWIQ